MTNDLESMLRASLEERAGDVEPTPELWRQVDRRISHRRALPLFVWTAAGVAAVVAAVAVVPGLVERVDDGLVIDPAESPDQVESPAEEVPGPVAAAPLSHYVAVVDGRLVLRGVDGSEEELWRSEEGAALTLAVRPGSTPERFTVATVASIEGMLDLAVVTRTRGETSATQTFVADDGDDGSTTPTLAWSPDGSTVATLVAAEGRAELVLFDPDGTTPEEGTPQQRIGLAGVEDPSALRLQDWVSGGEEQSVWFTSRGDLYRAPIGQADEAWDVGVLERTDGDDFTIDIATASDGTQYRLLAGGSSSGDAEDAGLAIEFDNERIAFPDLATADPSGAWMTAVEGGAIVGLGSDARLIVRDREGDSPVTAIAGATYAAWVPGAGTAAGTAADLPTAAPTDVPTAGPRADGPLSESGVTPYVAIDEQGRVAVHTGDGGEREVILDEQLWAPEAGVRAMDVSVRPGSSSGEVSGVALLATEGGPELAWFRAAAGATATARMEGATGLGNGDTDQRDAPTWSPDGLHLAWVEPDSSGGWTLRTVGMADNGPTDEDAGFGIDLSAERLHLADWQWDEEDPAGTARGRIDLVDAAAGRTYVLTIERQGDGALAVGRVVEATTLDGPEGTVLTLGSRRDETVSLVRTADGLVVRQAGGDVPVPPLPGDAAAWDLDLDVLADVSVVTDRSSGWAYVVDRAGGVASLEADAATTHGFDPVR